MGTEARAGTGSRRHGRGTVTGADSSPRTGFSLRRLFGRETAPEPTADWRTEAPMAFELGRMLMSLNSDFTVFRALDIVGELDADFVVVGPPGIFLITTRAHCDAQVWVDENVLWINGGPTDQVRDARSAAHRASTRLSAAIGHAVRATPVIAVMNPHSLSFGGDPTQRVVTLPADLVTQWLSECPRTLSDEAVAYFALIAEDRATWGSLPSDAGSLARVR